jgi:hypothetical protein
MINLFKVNMVKKNGENSEGKTISVLLKQMISHESVLPQLRIFELCIE